ncbi:MAG: hypothetical protein ACKOYJ_06550 [Planctomycetia bacterium]
MTAHRVATATALLATCLLATCLLATSAAAQPAARAAGQKGKAKPGNPQDLKRLDARLDEVRESFLRDTTALITSYENLGQYERARMLLESLQKLDPRNEPIKAKLGELTEKILESGEIAVEIVPGAPWLPAGTVTKDRPIRIRVKGDYKMILTTEFGPAGASGPGDDFVTSVPLGAVMGVIAPPGAAGQPGTQGDRPPRPFTVGDSYEKPADRDGVLFLRVNVPAGAKCTGRLNAQVSGPERPGQ